MPYIKYFCEKGVIFVLPKVLCIRVSTRSKAVLASFCFKTIRNVKKYAHKVIILHFDFFLTKTRVLC